MDINHPIEPFFTLWYHSLTNKKWDIESYDKLVVIKSLRDFWEVYNSISTFNNGMFFLMRENITPIWEDENNINGGVWSYRLSRKVLDKTWIELSIALIGNTLLEKNDDNFCNINGISVVPKKYNCILKIWNSDFKIKNKINKLDDIDTSRYMYKKHK
jgi:translation initiation factor 4E